MKYIVTVDKKGMEEIFVFPETVHHAIFADAVSYMRTNKGPDVAWSRVTRTPVSAGFISVDGQCVGESISLGLKSRPQDTNLLPKFT